MEVDATSQVEHAVNRCRDGGCEFNCRHLWRGLIVAGDAATRDQDLRAVVDLDRGVACEKADRALLPVYVQTVKPNQGSRHHQTAA